MSAQSRLTPNLPLPTIVGHGGETTEETPPDVVVERDKPQTLPSLLASGGQDLPASSQVRAWEYLGEALAAWYLMSRHSATKPCTQCPPQPVLKPWGVPPGWWEPEPRCEAARRAIRHLFRLGIPPPKPSDQSPRDSYDLMLAIRERVNRDHDAALAGMPT